MCLISRGMEFQTEGIAQEKDLRPNILVSAWGMRRVLESAEERICVDGEYIDMQRTRHINRGCIRAKNKEGQRADNLSLHGYSDWVVEDAKSGMCL